VPHLCYHPEFKPHGSCKVCTLKVDGRWVTRARCPRPRHAVDSRSEEIDELRRTLVQMLFGRGQPLLPVVREERRCKLQAVAYEVGMMTPRFDHFYPDGRSTPRTRTSCSTSTAASCASCGVRASSEVDGKGVFALSGRGITKHLVVNSESGRLADTDIAVTDKALEVCPVGVILRKRVASRCRSAPDAMTASRRASRRCATRRGRRRTPRREPRDEAQAQAQGGNDVAGWLLRLHMSFLDIDERLLELLDKVEFDRSPLTDIKHCGACDVGFIEAASATPRTCTCCASSAAAARSSSPSVACAINGGLPAQRNHLDLAACLREVYQTDLGLVGGGIPNDPELPLPLDKVRPAARGGQDRLLPAGCPPSADAIWKFLTDLLAGPHRRTWASG